MRGSMNLHDVVKVSISKQRTGDANGPDRPYAVRDVVFTDANGDVFDVTLFSPEKMDLPLCGSGIKQTTARPDVVIISEPPLSRPGLEQLADECGTMMDDIAALMNGVYGEDKTLTDVYEKLDFIRSQLSAVDFLRKQRESDTCKT